MQGKMDSLRRGLIGKAYAKKGIDANLFLFKISYSAAYFYYYAVVNNHFMDERVCAK